MRVEAVLGFADLAFEGFQTRRELAHFQLLGGGQTQLVGAARFDQIVGGARLDRVHRGIDRRMRGDNHHPHPWRLNAHLRQYIETVVFTQTQIKEA